MAIDIKKFEFGFVRLLLASIASLSITGSLSTALVAGETISSITLALPQAPLLNHQGVWLINAAGQMQRFQYEIITDQGGGLYSFNLKQTTVDYNFDVADIAYAELIPIVDYGDTVNDRWDRYIEVKAGEPTRDFPNVKEFWTCKVMVAVVYRTAQDKTRAKNTALYSLVEEQVIQDITAAQLSSATGITINGFLPESMEDGLFGDERFGSICGTSVKYTYS